MTATTRARKWAVTISRSTEEKKEPLPVPYQFRDVLTIPTYEYQGKSPNNVTHPDVLDFTLVNGVGGTPLGTWGGHRFWMAVTPNQEGFL